MKILKYMVSLAVLLWSTQNATGGKIWKHFDESLFGGVVGKSFQAIC